MREEKINALVQLHAYFTALFVNSNSQEIIDIVLPEDVCLFSRNQKSHL